MIIIYIYMYICKYTYIHIHIYIWSISSTHKSHNTADTYLSMQHFVTEMCTHVHISVTKWCIAGYGIGAFGDLQNRSNHVSSRYLMNFAFFVHVVPGKTHCSSRDIAHTKHSHIIHVTLNALSYNNLLIYVVFLTFSIIVLRVTYWILQNPNAATWKFANKWTIRNCDLRN